MWPGAAATAAVGFGAALPPRAPSGDLHAWHLYVLRLTDDAAIGRDVMIRGMSDRQIGCSVHFIPLHLHPYWRDTYGYKPDDFPAAYDTYKRTFSLPLYTKMSDADQDRVVGAVQELLS